MNLSVDWNSVFVPAIGLAEIVVRGSLMYLGLFVILRFMARRQAGHFGPADLLVIVLIADAAQNGLGKEYSSGLDRLALSSDAAVFEASKPYAHSRRQVDSPELEQGNDYRR
jgi:hypothetical protein